MLSGKPHIKTKWPLSSKSFRKEMPVSDLCSSFANNCCDSWNETCDTVWTDSCQNQANKLLMLLSSIKVYRDLHEWKQNGLTWVRHKVLRLTHIFLVFLGMNKNWTNLDYCLYTNMENKNRHLDQFVLAKHLDDISWMNCTTLSDSCIMAGLQYAVLLNSSPAFFKSSTTYRNEELNTLKSG